jgi:hypothetical protein
MNAEKLVPANRPEINLFSAAKTQWTFAADSLNLPHPL